MDMTSLPEPTLSEMRFDGIPVFTDPALFASCGVRIAFTTREGGVSAGPYASLNFGEHVEDDPRKVAQNQALLLRALVPSVPLSAAESLVVPKQVHGDRALSIDALEDVAAIRGKAAEGADAIIVSVREVAALLCFADCVPVIIVLPTGRFAVVHAGWRGVENTIAAKTLAFMLDQEEQAAGLSREVLAAGANVYIGPYIHRECFETSAEVHALFTQKFGDSCAFDAGHIDLGEALRVQLVECGVDPRRVCDLDRCTVCENDRFFSFRAQDGIAGRHGAFAIRI